MQFDRKKFFDGYRKTFGGLRQDHVQNLEFLLGKFEASRWFSEDVRRCSFALGNLYIETFIPKTGSRFAPVTESGGQAYFNRYDIEHNPRKARDLGNRTPGDGFKYRGRGFCQITGKTNYAKFDIADNPEKALEPDMAFYILERGIRYGVFTGRSVSTYINAEKTDYKEARRVINGQDRAKEIAGYCRSFEAILKSATAASVSEPVETANDTPSTTANGLTASPDDQTGLGDISTQPPITQNAENIVNVGDAAATPSTESVDMQAPPKDGATASTTKMAVFGVAIPGFVVAGIKTVQEWIAQGYISASEVGSTVLNFIRDNQKYVFILIGLIILLQIIKKIIKAVTFLFSMLTAAIPHWNTVNVIPVEAEPVKPWWKIW